MFKDFRDFAIKGNVVDLAVAFILGAAFTTIVRSLVDDIIMPPIGLLLGDVDFVNLFQVLKEGVPAGPYALLDDAQAAGAITINYGLFINAAVAFIIVALVLFLIVRQVVKIQRREEAIGVIPTTRQCPECQSTIALTARRCAFCTTEIAVT
jgi:large conductance mechanosensitive channel